MHGRDVDELLILSDLTDIGLPAQVGLLALVLAKILHVNLLLVDVLDHGSRAVWPRDTHNWTLLPHSSASEEVPPLIVFLAVLKESLLLHLDALAIHVHLLRVEVP